MTEDALQDAVIGTAQLFRWTVAHFRAAETAKGWRTPVSADGAGFPDLCMVHQEQRRLLFVELKTQAGRLRLEQKAWLATLMCVEADHIEIDVWRPTDWTSGRIEQALRGKREANFESRRLEGATEAMI